MSQRETVGPKSLQQWRGVNQRLQPTLVPDGFFSNASGVYFGYGDNAERLPGKTLTARINEPVLVIFTFNNLVLIQTLNTVRMVPLSELF